MKEQKERKITVLFCCVRVCCVLIMCCLTIGMNAQVTIGSNKVPQGGSLLELKEYDPRDDNETSDRGFIHPRVKLTNKSELYPMYSSTDANYLAKKDELKKSHAGLTVFNVNETSEFSPGLHIWSGKEWRRFESNPVIKPEVGTLLCPSAAMTPAIYKAGEYFEGIIKMPYLGGNGGSYESTAAEGGTPATNNLFIERIGGILGYGGGDILYRVYGTPLADSPTTTTFPITFFNQTCDVTVGGGISSVNLRNLEEDIVVNTLFHTNYNGELATDLKFGDITIEEAGSYAFSLRLYGLVGSKSATRVPYYIYLQRNDKTTLVDAAEIDLVILTTGDYTDYSYSITLGGVFDVGDKVIISMNKASNQASNWQGPNWRLKKGGNPTTPVRTSLIYWKL